MYRHPFTLLFVVYVAAWCGLFGLILYRLLQSVAVL